jgi:hypothetical protein
VPNIIVRIGSSVFNKAPITQYRIRFSRHKRSGVMSVHKVSLLLLVFVLFVILLQI